MANHDEQDPQTKETGDYQFHIHIQTQYLKEHSEPENERYVFGYTIRISNNGNKTAQLKSRRWVITDANGEVTEVEGEGVVGEQPIIDPGKSYEYTSGAVFKTPIGTMQGTYTMLTDSGVKFDAEIPLFSLTAPGVLH